jgi:hypothetical protein
VLLRVLSPSPSSSSSASPPPACPARTPSSPRAPPRLLLCPPHPCRLLRARPGGASPLVLVSLCQEGAFRPSYRRRDEKIQVAGSCHRHAVEQRRSPARGGAWCRGPGRRLGQAGEDLGLHLCPSKNTARSLGEEEKQADEPVRWHRCVVCILVEG